MASGQVCRDQRPNTWLLRPMLALVKKTLANPEPRPHMAPTGASRQCVKVPAMKAKRTVGRRSRHHRTDPFRKAGLSGYDTFVLTWGRA
jgi:hypothetical protein